MWNILSFSSLSLRLFLKWNHVRSFVGPLWSELLTAQRHQKHVTTTRCCYITGHKTNRWFNLLIMHEVQISAELTLSVSFPGKVLKYVDDSSCTRGCLLILHPIKRRVLSRFWSRWLPCRNTQPLFTDSGETGSCFFFFGFPSDHLVRLGSLWSTLYPGGRIARPGPTGNTVTVVMSSIWYVGSVTCAARLADSVPGCSSQTRQENHLSPVVTKLPVLDVQAWSESTGSSQSEKSQLKTKILVFKYYLSTSKLYCEVLSMQEWGTSCPWRCRLDPWLELFVSRPLVAD